MVALSLLAAAAAGTAAGESTARPTHTDEGKRIYYTVRLQGPPPRIDGQLDDDCWQQGEWSGDYTQQLPQEGAPPSQKTEIKILYDSENVYVAIKAYDDPELIDRRRGRRDSFDGDIVGVCFDSYFDRRTGFEFDLTASGAKLDLILLNEGWDTSWDAVWHGEVGIAEWGWAAEMRIPLSQLRYGDKQVHVWGLHSWRWINRLQEEDQWNLIPRDHPGMMYSIGELHGIENIPRSRSLELLPYLLTKYRSDGRVRGVPFAEPVERESSVGLDGKYALASNLTLDFTINPDFGQVEADPAVLNISAFETFYEEKRPFFLEAKNIFKFELDNDLLFYSRRIGQAPRYLPEAPDSYVRSPGNSSVLGAVKLSGKTVGGLSVGVIQGFTAREQATVHDSSGVRKEAVEPFSSYTVARVQQDFDRGNTVLGGMFAGVRRAIDDPHLDFLPGTALAGGIDLLHHWKDKTYYLDVRTVFSEVRGSNRAIAGLQTASARYYQRPDADYVRLDPLRDRLGGHGGSIEFGKRAHGRWRFEESLSWRSPGLELNDMGYLRIADVIRQETEVSYVVTEPVSFLRHYSVGGRQENVWNFGGEFLEPSGGIFGELGFRNRWQAELNLTRIGSALDTRLLRGGPAVRIKGFWSANYELESDRGRRLNLTFRHHAHYYDDQQSRYRGFYPGVRFRVIDALLVSTNLEMSRNRDMFQYVSRQELAGQRRDLTGLLDQKTLGLTFRVDMAITPNLTIQYYGNPFVSTGRFLDFKRFVEPRARDYSRLFRTFGAGEVDFEPALNRYLFDETGDGIPDYAIGNPDFSYREFRSNLVARWEYSPGSVLFVVWTQGRFDHQPWVRNSLAHNLGDLFSAPADNVFLVKFNHWFSLP